MYDGQLARTGTVGLVIGGLAIGGLWLVVAAVVLVVVGATMVRFSFRRGRSPAE